MSYGIVKQLNKDNIYSKIDSFAIFKRYCEGFDQLDKAFKSPLRDDDKHPSSFVIFYKGDLMFKDFGKGSFRAIDFVMVKYNLDYYQAMQKINCDFNLKLGFDYDPNCSFHYEPIEFKKEDQVEKKTSIINIKRREFNRDDAEYWFGCYRITQKTTELFSVLPISHFTINDYLYFSASLSYSYNYYWENNVFRRKIYQPLSWNKWYSNGGLVVQGEGMLPKNGELLVVTSSLKDVMALYEFGITAVAPTSESTFLPMKYFVKQNDRFKRIVLFMDSDEAGMEANKRLSEKWGLDYIIIPQSFKSKDFSDLVKNKGNLEAGRFLYDSKLITY